MQRMPDLQTLPFTPSSPWIRALVAQPNTAIRIPSNRVSKLSTEDSLFAETLQTSRTFPECFIFYRDPALSAPRSSSSGTSGEDAESRIQEVHFLVRVGDGLNGHPAILHGGIVAALVDEGMGVLQTVNHERAHARSVQRENAIRWESSIFATDPAFTGVTLTLSRIAAAEAGKLPGRNIFATWHLLCTDRQESAYARLPEYSEAALSLLALNTKAEKDEPNSFRLIRAATA